MAGHVVLCDLGRLVDEAAISFLSSGVEVRFSILFFYYFFCWILILEHLEKEESRLTLNH